MSKNSNKSGFFAKLGAGIKESIRKALVSLKRRPHNIPLVLLLVSFFVYSLNTSAISDTTNTLLGKNMGFLNFVTMLVSILVFVVFLDAFPKRQKPNVVMLVIMYVMFAVMILCDIFYTKSVNVQITKFDPEVIEKSLFINKALGIVKTHAIMIAIEAVLVATLPIYSRLFNKIKTSVDVEENAAMGEIEISEE